MSEHFHPDRLDKLAALRELGHDAYPARSPDNREMAADLLAAFETRQGETATVCGRVLGRRGYGKLAFIDLGDQSGKIQVVLEKANLSADDFAILSTLNLGDIITATGPLQATQKGQPSLYGHQFAILTKALLNPPADKQDGLSDTELRARMRYVDLFANEGVRDGFLRRSAILRGMREIFHKHGYAEVETPVLQSIYGGANAAPFTTHHNALDMGLYLRIALELPLKRLIVGGMERVFEMGRVFRNEGISTRHNPEFTMVEWYEAYADYERMAEMVQELVVGAAIEAGCQKECGAITTTFRSEVFDLTPPFARVQYRDAFQEHVGCDPADRDAVAAARKTAGFDSAGEGDYAYWKSVNDLFEELVEPQLRGPVFVMDYPAAICPLTKAKTDDPEWAERFEFFLGGMELANAYSELNDPQIQLAKLQEQVADADPESPNQVDYDFVRALAYGMPPTGGCGLGIDRLAMVLTGNDSIRDVLLFPHMRPETQE